MPDQDAPDVAAFPGNLSRLAESAEAQAVPAVTSIEEKTMHTATAGPDVDRTMSDAVNDAITRTVAIVGLCSIALIHVLDVPGKFTETPYLGIMYIGAIVASMALAAILTRTSDQRVWAAAGGLAAAILLGYILSRTTGLPNATDDIGNWSEPLGLASLFVEGALVCLTAGVLTTRRHSAGSPVERRIEAAGRHAPGTQFAQNARRG